MSPPIKPKRCEAASTFFYYEASGDKKDLHHVPHYTAQALRARGKRAVVGCDKHCDNKDAQPGVSAAATSTATTTMHSPAASHTAGVAATYATLARSSTRTM
jgi:hypothetical protein